MAGGVLDRDGKEDATILRVCDKPDLVAGVRDDWAVGMFASHVKPSRCALRRTGTRMSLKPR